MAKDTLLGKKGLILGVANERSLAWKIAQYAGEQGAQLALTYQGEGMAKRMEPLKAKLPRSAFHQCDVSTPSDVTALVKKLEQDMGKLDFIVHAIAYANKEALKGRFIETSQEDFQTALNISAYSLVHIVQQAERILNPDSAILSLSFLGAQKVVPHYNVMGVAKAALEASIRYLAADLGPKKIRVNALSAGPVRTISGAAISGARSIFQQFEDLAPLKENPPGEDIAKTAIFLISPQSQGITGSTIMVDGGAHIMAIPPLT